MPERRQPGRRGGRGGPTLEPLAHATSEDEIPLLGCTIGELLRRRAREDPDRDAMRWPTDGGVAGLPYAELLARAERLAGALLELAQPGDCIGVWSHNCIEWVELEYACALSGVVIAGWNAAWTDAEVEHAIALTRPRAVFAARETRGFPLLERVTRLARDIPVFDIDTVGGLAPSSPTALPDLGEDAPFLIQFTSGTTGAAKGAVLSHRAALNGANQNVKKNGVDGDVWLNPVPMHHIGGSVHIALGALCLGGTWTVMERFDPALLAELVRPTGATRTGGVPTMLLGMLEHEGFPAKECGIRVVALGGATVPTSLVERVEREFGASASIAFGQSECPAITITAPDDPAEIKASTVGRPVSHSEIKIVDVETGETLRVGDVGELCVRSPMVMDGYVANPTATAKTIDADGFLHTGDLASMDAECVFRIHGRSRDVIIRGGENVYPPEVEDALLRHEAVANAAVVGMEDERWGQQVAAFVQLVDGRSAEEGALAEFAGKRVAHFKVPTIWRFVTSLPQTASGKIRKVELEARLAGEVAAGEGP
jgi:fatty-acyl-CoA synthase